MYSPANTVHDYFISNLEITFSKSFHIQDAGRTEHASEGDDCRDTKEGNLGGDLIRQETKVDKKWVRKCANLTYPNTMMLPPSSSDAEDEKVDVLSTELSHQSEDQPYSHSVSLPTHLKLVSAMKGSREKQGGSRMKLTVKWAPDVYDPVPTSESHSVKSKRQHKSWNKKSAKKNGKGQKGTNSRRSGKDKQFRKSTGTSDKWYKLLDSHKIVKSSTELDVSDFTQDSFCGTSFLKKSVTQVHYSVAEAQ